MKWYAAKTENAHDQGLVIDEETGENIAVTYKAENAPKIAAMPELLEALQNLVGMCNMPEVKAAMMKHNQAYYHATMHEANHAIRQATDKQRRNNYDYKTF